MPWSSWLSEDGTEEQVTDLFGPDILELVGSSPARTVKISAADGSKIQSSVLIYAITFPSTFAFWLASLWLFLRQHVGRLAAVLGLAAISLVTLFCISFVLITPAVNFFSDQLLMLSSTWTVEFELQSMRLEGPLTLLVGVVLGMAAAFWAVRAHRRPL
jgi:hypothetical protein